MVKEFNIPGYKIKSLIGSGGMSRVFLAEEKKLKRPVALKVLFPNFSESKKITRRFLKEARTSAQLQHPNIVSIYDVGRYQDYYYIAMEYLKENLKKRISTGKTKAADALYIIREVAKALLYAHKKGFIHRDIKSENIMFNYDGGVLLVDFGIVKALNSETKLTKTGVSIGTPQYMSPEQVKGWKLDERSDIYSLGIVLFEILTGSVPYRDGDIITLALKHVKDPIPRLPKKYREYQLLVDKMLAKNPGERVRNTAGLIRLIDALEFKLKNKTRQSLKTPSDLKKEQKLPGRGKKTVKGSFIAIIFVILMVVISLFLIRESSSRREKNLWQDISIINTIESYHEYLTKYPQGEYVQSVKVKIANLEKRDQDYNKFMNQAVEFYKQGQYIRARNNVTLARSIRETAEARNLEERISSKIKKSGDNPR